MLTIRELMEDNAVSEVFSLFLLHKMEQNLEIKTKGCVYFFRHIGLTPVKIGYSTHESPIERFEQFKTYAPYGSEIIGFIRTYDAKELETTLHERFSQYRLNGEWFEITEEQCNVIISFYSNIEDIKEKNEFQIKFAKYIYNKNYKVETNLNNKFHVLFDEFINKIGFGEYVENYYFNKFINLKLGYEVNIKSLKHELKEYCRHKKYEIINKTIKNNRCFCINQINNNAKLK